MFFTRFLSGTGRARRDQVCLELNLWRWTLIPDGVCGGNYARTQGQIEVSIATSAERIAVLGSH